MSVAFNAYRNKGDFVSVPVGYLTTYNRKTGIEVFEEAYRGFLKLLNQLLTMSLWSHISPRCFHLWGGAKMMLREWKAWGQPGDFIFKTDVYSYYASVNHGILLKQLVSLSLPYKVLETLMAYCRRTILSEGKPLHCTQGLPKGGALSPSLGALYLSPLDQAMERWSTRDDCFYARFQDDILIASRKRHLYRAMRREMYRCLEDLRLSLRFEKTFMGRSEKGFELLGYSIKEEVSLNLKTQEKALRKAKQRYAQGGLESLLSYLKGWRTWGQAGLPFRVQNLDTAVLQVKEAALSAPHSGTPRDSEHGGRRRKDIFPSPNQPWAFISCVIDERLFNPKGDLKCKPNFFKHYS